MLRVGLTGNVAAGKSTVAALFAEWGAVLIDADVLAREAVAPGTRALAAIAARFGASYVGADGALDRAALRRHVMGDAAARAALNAIVHPEVRRLRTVREAEARRAGARVVVHDIPLLFEVLDPAAFDGVVFVDAPEAVRRDRLVRLRGLAREEADALIAAQLPPELKRARATWVIVNDRSMTELRERARAVWTELQARAGTS
jgi:dephospho-CoA kinase